MQSIALLCEATRLLPEETNYEFYGEVLHLSVEQTTESVLRNFSRAPLKDELGFGTSLPASLSVTMLDHVGTYTACV